MIKNNILVNSELQPIETIYKNISILNTRTARLPVGVVYVNVIRTMCVVAHDCTLFASVLVGLLHCVCVPVRPVDPVLKQGNSKNMGKRTSNGPVSVLAVHVCKAKG